MSFYEWSDRVSAFHGLSRETLRAPRPPSPGLHWLLLLYSTVAVLGREEGFTVKYSRSQSYFLRVLAIFHSKLDGVQTCNLSRMYGYYPCKIFCLLRLIWSLNIHCFAKISAFVAFVIYFSHIFIFSLAKFQLSSFNGLGVMMF